MIAWMKNVNNFQLVKIQLQGLAKHLLHFLPISAFVAYKSVAYKKACIHSVSALLFVIIFHDCRCYLQVSKKNHFPKTFAKFIGKQLRQSHFQHCFRQDCNPKKKITLQMFPSTILTLFF